MIAAGTYQAVASGTQWGTAGEDNKKQIVVAFRLLDGPQVGQSISWFGYFTTKTWERTVEALRLCGWKGTDLENLGSLDQKVELVIEHEEYEGKTRARVQWVNKLGGGQVKLKNPMSPTEVRGFAAMMKDRCAQIKEVDGERVAAEAVQQAVSQESAPPIQDDIPF